MPHVDDHATGTLAAQLATVVDGAPDGMLLCDADLCCTWVNPSFAALSGLPIAALTDVRVSTALGELGRGIEGTLRTVRATNVPVIGAEVTGHLPADATARRTWQVTCWPAGGTQGAAEVAALVSDVTERAEPDGLRATEEHFRLLVESVTDYAILMLDADGRVVTWNAGAQRILGYEADEILGCHVSHFHTSEEAPNSKAPHLLRIAAVDGRVTAEDWRARKDGSRFWASAVITALYRPDGQLRGYSKVVRDLTQQRVAEAALRESETTLRSLLQSASDGVIVVDQEGRIASVNTRAEQMFGYAADELVGRPVEVLVPDRLEDVHKGYRNTFMQSPRTRPMGHGLDLTAQRRDGTEFPVEVGLGTAQVGEVKLVTVVVTDITERKRVEQQLAHQATHDALTGLPNRVLFTDRLVQALRRIPRRAGDSDMVAVLFFDLDRFKVINDSLGHQAGDAVLRLVGHRLRELLRPSDTVARFGGDEFAMLCEGLRGARDAARIAGRILNRMGEPFVLPHGDHVVTPSIGIALASRADVDPEELLRDADAAMYQAKERGKARFELFDAKLREQTVTRLETENGLRRAIERGELRLMYQPIVALASARPVGVEALVRWERPGHGLVAPDAFIPIAEETGLITRIGAWVLAQACSRAARWQGVGAGRGLQVSVNLSVRQLTQPDIVDAVADVVHRTGLDPAQLRFEITESALIADPEAGLLALRGLSGLGASVAIDDFGTGYSSLSRLRHFPVDALKVDREFVDGLGRDPADFAIVAAVVGLAHAYGITTVAEGVETPQQVAILTELGCEYGQGYHYSPPVTAEQIDALIV